MVDVFLSYSYDDSHAASRLAAQLRQAGITVFWDREDIKVGEAVTQALSSAIAEARAFVLLDPGRMSSSTFIHKEIRAAIARSATSGVPVLPVLLPGREPASEIGSFRYIRVASDDDFSPVVQVVKSVLNAANRSRPTSAGLRLSFLSSLLNTDLGQAPRAAAVLLDEIAQTVGVSNRVTGRQLAVLREAAHWGEVNLGPEHPSVVSLRYRLTKALLRSGRYEESLGLSEEAVRTSSSPEERLEASLNLGNALLASGREEAATERFQESLHLARSTNSESASGTAIGALATLARMRGDLTVSRRLFEEAVEITTRVGQPSARVSALIGLCEVAAQMGDAESTRHYADEALWLSRTALARDDDLTLRAAAIVAARGGRK